LRYFKKGFEEKMKKIWIIVASLISLGIISYISFTNFCVPVRGFEVTIENLAGESINGIYLTCKGLEKDIEVPLLKPHDKIVTSVQPKNYGENSIVLYYKEVNGLLDKQTLVGYFEESYGNGYVTVKIENIETGGKLKINSKYKFANSFGLSKWY
jgi:hypothetical protein